MVDAPARPAPPDYQHPRIAELVVANATDYAIMTMDDAGVVTSWSPGAERIFGYAADEAIGRDGAFLFVPSDVAAEAPRKELDTARREGRAENSRWHLRKGGERFWGNGVAMRLADGSGFVKILRDETTTKLAEEQRVLLLNELNHRIKNTLATVQSIAEQTLRAGQVGADTRENLASRLVALGQAHDVLVRENWAGADLQAIVRQALSPHAAGGPARLDIDGPPVRLSPQQALSLSLALHELATNALKYGSLSAPEGRVSVTWNLALDGQGGRHMNLLWRETGGPPVRRPDGQGFGMRLLARLFPRESGGRAKAEFLPGGFQCVIEMPLADIDSPTALDIRTGELTPLPGEPASGP